MENNRQSQRQPITVKRECDLGVFASKQTDRTDHRASIVDISNNGVGIESSTPMEPGLVWFRNRIWGQQSGVLLWSRQVGTQYRSGIRFTPFLYNDESAPREPLKDVERLISLHIESIKQDAGQELL